MIRTKTIAGAALAVLLGGAAQAATFDFTFYLGNEGDGPEVPRLVGPDEVGQALIIVPEIAAPVIGTGVMSYDGAVAEGISELSDLESLTLDFTIGEWSWDEDDIMPSPGPVFWAVENSGGVYTGSFGGGFDELEDVARAVQAEPLCGLIGSVLLYNGEQCFTAAPFHSFPGEYAIYEADGLLMEPVLVAAEPQFGLYEAIARTGTPPAPVPLPATLPLLALALGGMGYARSRRS